MNCSSCGTQLQSDSNFCHRCGQPINGTSTRNSARQTIEIKLEPHPIGCLGFLAGKYHSFQAVAIGTTLVVAESSKFRVAPDRDRDVDDVIRAPYIEKEHQKLLDELTTDGWQVITSHRRYWFDYALQKQ